ncbi:class I SAM-dependent methyltransferase [Sutcliffiella horikoshii]|uniref:class I SAM-dependent methyltransferase n=1 Tax=Sutcliffiella horikoshii TaxID=79883 RepID=UPI00203ADCB9|nr:class I SAM-dependent methyltransferase [Sutcliffiella horikoshii]MCM3619452.1 class I SAM-dependent methyltransferase [Sutcliffiella horikoshii]
MSITKLENTFTLFDSTAQILQEELDCTYLEALAETAENLFHGAVIQEEVSEVTKRRLEKEYSKLSISSLQKEEIRKGYQLAILKGMKDAVQANHQMTPDAIAMFMGYLVGKYTLHLQQLTLLDPAIGTGNLLTAVLNHQPNKRLEAFGVDVDDLLVKLAYSNANLQEQAISLFNQDGLSNLFIEPVDVVVSDLPVGYYPDDTNAANFKLKAEEGHSYAHYLFIEQSLRYTKPGGHLLFLVPNSLFDEEEAKRVNTLIKDEAYIQGMLQLPETMFQNKNHAKSILVLQKKGIGVEPPKEALLVNLPSFSNMQAMEKIMGQINDWFSARNEKK